MTPQWNAALAGAAIALCLGSASAAQLPEPKGVPIKAAEVCLTNACSDPLNIPRNAPAVAAAVRVGNYRAILRAGGGAEDVLAGAQAYCRRNREAAARLMVCGEIEPGSARLAARDGMATLTFTPKGADGTRPGDITKVEMILTEEPESPDAEIMDSVLPPPPGR